MKKNKLLLGVLGLAALGLTSCSKCNDDDPLARIANNGTSTANLQITASNGDVVSITELEKGTISSEKVYSVGTTILNGTIENEQISDTFELSTCTAYDITINSDNEIVLFSQTVE
ncbi:hypothetical protein [Brumimicrobium aurantiacum]|nr:hypothetical protein [Brumimicrobium aurantiacum]